MQHNLRHIAPKVEVAAATADCQILIHGVERHECARHAQDAQQRYAAHPFVADGAQNEFLCHQCEAEHQRKRHEGGEAHHLPIHTASALSLIASRHEHGLHHLPQRVGNEGVGHRVPLVGLCEVAHLLHGEVAAKNEGEDIAAERVDDVGHQNFHAETEHLPYRSEVDFEHRAPVNHGVSADVEHGDVDNLLPCQTPVGVAVECQRDARNARHSQRQTTDKRLLAVHQVFVHIRGVGDAKRGNHKSQKHKP